MKVTTGLAGIAALAMLATAATSLAQSGTSGSSGSYGSSASGTTSSGSSTSSDRGSMGSSSSSDRTRTASASTGMSGSSNLDAKDRKFVMEAAEGGMLEVEAGRLAQTSAQDPQVKQLASTIVNDHQAANDKLKSIAQSKGMTLPTSLDHEHQAKLDKLKKAQGSDFDKQFVQMMEEIKLLLRYAFQTGNALTFAVSGPGSVGMETCSVEFSGTFGDGTPLTGTLTGEGVPAPSVTLSLSGTTVNASWTLTGTSGPATDYDYYWERTNTGVGGSCPTNGGSYGTFTGGGSFIFPLNTTAMTASTAGQSTRCYRLTMAANGPGGSSAIVTSTPIRVP